MAQVKLIVWCVWVHILSVTLDLPVKPEVNPTVPRTHAAAAVRLALADMLVAGLILCDSRQHSKPNKPVVRLPEVFSEHPLR